MTSDELIIEIRETTKDLVALKRSRDLLHMRLREQEGTPRYEESARWPLMQALINIYISAIVRCEGLIEDYTRLLYEMDAPANVIQLQEVKHDR